MPLLRPSVSTSRSTWCAPFTWAPIWPLAQRSAKHAASRSRMLITILVFCMSVCATILSGAVCFPRRLQVKLTNPSELDSLLDQAAYDKLLAESAH